MFITAIVVVAAAAVIGGIVWWMNQSASATKTVSRRQKTIDEMNETELAAHVDGLVDNLTQLDGIVVQATEELAKRGREMLAASEEVKRVNTVQPGNIDALQAAIDAYEGAEQAYEDQLAFINGTDRQPGLKAQAADAKRDFQRVKASIDKRQNEFAAGKVAILRQKIRLGDGSVQTVTSNLEVKPDANLETLRKMRAAAEMEGQLIRGDADRAEEYRRDARTKALLNHLGIGANKS